MKFAVQAIPAVSKVVPGNVLRALTGWCYACFAFSAFSQEEKFRHFWVWFYLLHCAQDCVSLMLIVVRLKEPALEISRTVQGHILQSRKEFCSLCRWVLHLCRKLCSSEFWVLILTIILCKAVLEIRENKLTKNLMDMCWAFEVISIFAFLDSLWELNVCVDHIKDMLNLLMAVLLGPLAFWKWSRAKYLGMAPV